MKEKIKFVAVSGYGSSGSSAVVNLLKEFEGYWDLGGEMRLLREPYGICDLEHSLIDEWDVLNSDIAIRDFVWLVERLNRKSSKWGGTGCGYSELFGPTFLEETEKYIAKLTAFEFRGYWWWFDFKQSNLRMVLNRIKKKLCIMDFKDMGRMRFVDLSEEEFLNITKSYIVNLYIKCTQAKNIELKTAILDQAVSLNQFARVSRYFDDLRLIVVDRDPRDAFVEQVKRKLIIGREVAQSHDINKYVRYYKKMREGIKEKKQNKILYIKFEDLILDYENTREKILLFLGESRDIHINKHKYLNLEESKKNIGVWRKYAFQGEIRKIEDELM